MATEVKIPNVGESITSANVARWHKQDGESVSKGETVLTIETDKVSNDLDADASGTLRIIVPEGEEVPIGTVVARIEEGSVAPQESAPAETAPGAPAQNQEAKPAASSPNEGKVIEIKVPAAGESITSASVGRWHVSNGASVAKGDSLVTLETDKISNELEADDNGVISIVVAEGEEVGIGTVIATLTVGAAPEAGAQPAPAAPAAEQAPPAAPTPAAAPAPAKSAPAATTATAAPAPIKPDLSVVPDPPERAGQAQSEDNGRTTRKKMSMLRRKIASHLVNAQQTAAILTTFNEVDMTAVMKLRKEVQEEFVSKYGCKLGFMSFFVKATVQALKDVPGINARIDGTDIIENNFYDVFF